MLQDHQFLQYITKSFQQPLCNDFVRACFSCTEYTRSLLTLPFSHPQKFCCSFLGNFTLTVPPFWLARYHVCNVTCALKWLHDCHCEVLSESALCANVALKTRSIFRLVRISLTHGGRVAIQRLKTLVHRRLYGAKPVAPAAQVGPIQPFLSNRLDKGLHLLPYRKAS